MESSESEEEEEVMQNEQAPAIDLESEVEGSEDSDEAIAALDADH